MSSSILANIDLLTVGTVVAATFVLGFTTYFSDTRNKTNAFFLLLATVTGLWGTLNYFGYKILNQELALLFLRIAMFLAVWQAFFIFKVFSLFPNGQENSPRIVNIFLWLIAIVTSYITLTNHVLYKIAETLDTGRISKITNGDLIPLFGLVSIGFVTAGVIIMAKKTRQSAPKERLSYLMILLGTIITFSLIICFNFLFPAFLNNPSLIPLGALFTFPLIFLTAYSFSRGILNVKVLSTSILVFFLSIITFFEVLFTEDFYLLILRSFIFGIILLFGLFLIRSVMREVHQREYIEKLAGELAQTNDQLKTANDKLRELDKQKTEFVSIASHQLRSPLTAIKGYSSMLLEGSFGPIEDKAKEAVGVVFQSSLKLINIIEDFLNITRIELGRMKYEISTFDLGKIVETVINDQIPNIKKKGLTSKLEKGESDDTYLISADNGKITQVISNLIDNSIKYTPQGEIKAKIENLLISGKSVIRFSISDTGVGIDQETLPRLFDKFVRADDAGKTNITGTGLGLYVAKQIVESLGGKIWAESEGKGKGSTFIVEFPKAEGEITQTDHKVEFYTKADFNKLKGK